MWHGIQPHNYQMKRLMRQLVVLIRMRLVC